MEIWKNLSLENIEGEIWKDVKGHEKYYMVSNMGRFKVKPCLRVYAYEKGVINPSKTRKKSYYERIKKQYSNKQGYILVHFNGDTYRASVSHRIVGENFIPNPENKPFINHKNGIRHDNREVNLEWCTRVENERHSWNELGRQSIKGMRHGFAKLTDDEVYQVRKIYEVGYRGVFLVAAMFNVDTSTIYGIVRGRTWKHLP